MTDESDVFCFRVLSIIHFGIDWCCNSFGCRAIPCHTPIWWTIASQGKWPWWRCCHWIPLPSWWTGRCLSQSCGANENWSTTSVLGNRPEVPLLRWFVSIQGLYLFCSSVCKLFEYDKLEDRGANTSGPSTRHNVTCTESTGSCRELAGTFNVLLLDSCRCLTFEVKQIDPYFFMASHGRLR